TVEGLFEELIARRELGEAPSLVELERRLATDAQRAELRGLVAALEQVDGELPLRIHEGTLVAGRYRIRRELGKGGLGRVFVAHDERNDGEVALKALETTASPLEAGHLLRRERQALVRLRHPNIVVFLDADRWRNCFYLVMELVDGIGIAEVVERIGSER